MGELELEVGFYIRPKICRNRSGHPLAEAEGSSREP